MIDNPAANLKAARLALGMTGAALVRALGIARSTLARYEAGRQPTPRAITLAVERLQSLKDEEVLAFLERVLADGVVGSRHRLAGEAGDDVGHRDCEPRTEDDR